MSNGKACRCNAHCEHECCCDADWTPKEVYDLRAELAQRTAEVAKANAERDEAVDALKRIATYDYRGNQSGESQIARHALIAMRKEGGAA